jgi:RNA polymerase sigma-70 factor (ECF subfamily)
MDQAAERDLLARCRAGDEAAFGELVDHYRNLVFGLVLRAVSDRTRTEDLAQEVFLRIWRGLPYFRGDARLSTWIYRIVQNVCIEGRERHRANLPLDDLGPASQPQVIDRAFATVELRDRIDKALAQLPEQARFLIAAHYFGGRQYEELAEDLNVPLGTIKTQLFRAKRLLREIMSEGRLPD